MGMRSGCFTLSRSKASAALKTAALHINLQALRGIDSGVAWARDAKKRRRARPARNRRGEHAVPLQNHRARSRLQVAGGLEEEPDAALRLVDPDFQQAGGRDVVGLVA